MTVVAQQAAVAPATVTAYSRGQLAPARAAARPRRAHTATRGSAVQVHPLVWAAALGRCGGQPRRIQVLSPTEVRIHNDASWRDA